MGGLDLTPEDVLALIACAVASAAIILAGWLAESRNLWLRRCRDRDATIASLRDALADARYQRTARQQPAPVTEWVDDTAAPRARRRHWHTRLSWPGLNTGRVPFGYGDRLDRPVEDPCLRPAAPTDAELREWILTDRCIDTLCGESGWSVAALPSPVHPRSIFASPASKARLAMPSPDRWDCPSPATQLETIT